MPSHSRFFSLAMVAVLFMSASGCVCFVGNRSGNIVLTWTFDGMTCSQQAFWATSSGVPQVASVTVDIPGQTLANGGTYPCNTGGTDGIELTNFAPGTYQYTVRAWSAQGEQLYAATGSVTVNGDVAAAVALRSLGRPGDATFLWTFDGRSCAQQAQWAQSTGAPAVTKVTIDIPGQTLGNNGTYACNTAGTDGITLTNFAAGTYQYTVRGWAANNEELYSATGSITINGSIQNSVSLYAEKGGLAIAWQFSNGGPTTLTCQQAGVLNVYVNLQDNTGLWVYGNGPGAMIACNNSWGDGTVFPWLAPGTYTIVVQGYDTVNTLYRTNQNQPPYDTVTAAVFPTVNAQSQVVLLAPQ